MNKVILTGRLVNDNWKPFKSEKDKHCPLLLHYLNKQIKPILSRLLVLIIGRTCYEIC